MQNRSTPEKIPKAEHKKRETSPCDCSRSNYCSIKDLISSTVSWRLFKYLMELAQSLIIYTYIFLTCANLMISEGKGKAEKAGFIRRRELYIQ